MPRLFDIVGRFIRDEKGATAIEYGLIAGLIAVGVIVSMTAFGNSLSGMFNFVKDEATTAMDNAGG
jgi:pilus assembly protein Flp/PilA